MNRKEIIEKLKIKYFCIYIMSDHKTHSLDLLKRVLRSFLCYGCYFLDQRLPYWFWCNPPRFDAKSKDKFKAIIVGLGGTLAVFVNYIFSRTLQYVRSSCKFI